MNEILIGYVKDFTFHNEKTKEMLNSHPMPGGIYRVIKNIQSAGQYADGAPHEVASYQVYIDRSTNNSKLDTIYIGHTLNGDYQDKWSFDIDILDKDNYLDYDYAPDDLEKLKVWLDSDNADLRELMTKNSMPVDMNQSGEFVPGAGTDPNFKQALDKILTRGNEIDKSFESMTDSMNIIMSNDIELSMVLSDVLKHIADSYGDKYEAGARPNLSKAFILSSSSPDTAIFNSFKYLQRYCTQGFEKSGNPKDIYKAIHYCLFELQRQNINE